ncbi:unnamed protein product [Adineta ricciae]|uniref:Uncharacterized protein n=1 Tax=Adineta ricciae TaxID=249248 RepID=A0A815EUW6_ADIRI|nr:unnamed protein product [Adineta ricciae]CAF1512158.1 unnamed protein product [Adineta ricciae]
MASNGESFDKRSRQDKTKKDHSFVTTPQDSSLETESKERFIPEIMDQKIDPRAIETLKAQQAVMEQVKQLQARGIKIQPGTRPRPPFSHDTSVDKSPYVHTSSSIILESTSTQITEENEEDRERFPVESSHHPETISRSDASMTHLSRDAFQKTPIVGEPLVDYMRRKKEEALAYERRSAPRGYMWDDTASDDGDGGHSRPNILRKQRSKSVGYITEIKDAHPHSLIDANDEPHEATPGSTRHGQRNIVSYNMPAEYPTYVKTRRGRWRRIARFFVPSSEVTTEQWASTPSQPQPEPQTRPESHKPNIIRRLGRLLLGQVTQNEFGFY